MKDIRFMNKRELYSLDIEDLKKARDKIALEDSILTISNFIGGLSQTRKKTKQIHVDLPKSKRSTVNNLVSKIKQIKDSKRYKHNRTSPVLNKVQGKLKDLITKHAKSTDSRIS
jgi:hypothetical protein